MIDLHTHTLFSDGALLPFELARRAEDVGYRVIGITDHVDSSNIDFVIPRIVKACNIINKNWKIKAIPGAEITHAPLREIRYLVRFARKKGAKIIIGHGETVTEPVLKGTNKEFIKAKVDILAHPGKISVEDIRLAKKNNVFLEVSARKSHSKGNKYVISSALKHGARMILNTDTHTPDNLITKQEATKFLHSQGLNYIDAAKIINNSVRLIKRWKIK